MEIPGCVTTVFLCVTPFPSAFPLLMEGRSQLQLGFPFTLLTFLTCSHFDP